MVQFKLNFPNNPTLTFFSGYAINGSVEITLKKSVEIKAISLKTFGKAKVKWRQGKNSTYRSKTVYVDSTRYLLPPLNGENSTQTLDAGSHVYDFSYYLPPEMPSSLDGCNRANIYYELKVTLEKSWSCCSKSFNQEITVVRPTDLNQNPALMSPGAGEIKYKFLTIPCAMKEIFLQASIPQTGFVPGQQVPVSIKIQNLDKKIIESINLSLEQVITFTGEQRACCLTSKRTLKNKSSKNDYCFKNLQNSEYEEHQMSISIPVVPPTCPENICWNIQVDYRIKISLKTQGLHFIPTAKIPITIGTVPLNGSFKLETVPQMGYQSSSNNEYTLQNPSAPRPDSEKSKLISPRQY